MLHADTPHQPAGQSGAETASVENVERVQPSEFLRTNARATPSSSPATSTFNDEAAAVVRIGSAIVAFGAVARAIRDPNCKRHHLKILLAIVEMLGGNSGTAFPNRKTVALQEGLNPDVAANAFYDLRRWGYLIWAKRIAPDRHPGRLVHYTVSIGRWSEQEISRATRQLRARLEAVARSEVTTAQNLVQSPKETPQARVQSPNETAQNSVPKTTHDIVHSNLDKRELKKQTKTSSDLEVSFVHARETGAVSDAHIEAAAADFNALADRLGFPGIRFLTPARRQRLAAILAEHGSGVWQRFLDAIAHSKWLRGQAWRQARVPDIDWMLGAENFALIVERTRYEDKPQHSTDLGPTKIKQILETLPMDQGLDAQAEEPVATLQASPASQRRIEYALDWARRDGRIDAAMLEHFAAPALHNGARFLPHAMITDWLRDVNRQIGHRRIPHDVLRRVAEIVACSDDAAPSGEMVSHLISDEMYGAVEEAEQQRGAAWIGAADEGEARALQGQPKVQAIER